MTDASNEMMSGGLPDVLSSLMANEELMSQISKIVNEDAAPNRETEQDKEKPTDAPFALNPQTLEKLPEVVAAIRPFLTEENQPRKKPTGGGATDHRTALLCALKPYLSPRRREAIDYITRISKLGELMKQMKF